MNVPARGAWKRVTNGALSVLVAVSALATLISPVATEKVNALASASAVYSALPSTSPSTNYPSLGYAATSTTEFGDSIHLTGTNRILDNVTVTLSDWAKYSQWSGDNRYSGNNEFWSHPITVNVYDAHLGANGAPDTLLATKTQSVSIPWRPESDPNCASTSNGLGWTENGTCYNFSGIASNVTVDFDNSVTLPDDIIVGIAFNTENYGTSPLHVSGPYNSLNVAVPDNQTVTAGSDDNATEVFWNTSYAGFYTDGGAGGTGTFRKDTNWTYLGANEGTVALAVNATTLDTPTNLTPIDGTITNNRDFVMTWDAVDGATQYEYRTSHTVSGGQLGSIAYADDSVTSSRFDLSSSTVVRYNFGTPDGDWYWQVRAGDDNGNWSDWSDISLATVDGTAPSAPTLVTPTPYIANGASKTLTWNASASSDVDHYEYAEYNFVAPSSDTTTPSWVKNVTGTTTTDTAWQSDINIYWRVRAIDHAGNASPWSETRLIMTDRTKPTATLTTPVAGSYNPSSIVVVANDSNSLNRVTANIYNAANTTLVKACSSPVLALFTKDDTLTCSTAGLAEGTYTIRANANDRAGNTSVTTTRQFTIDTTAPVVTVTGLTTTNHTPTVTGTTDDSAVVKLTVNGVTYDVTPAGDGTWSYELPNLADGTYTMTVSQTDAANNASNVSLAGSSAPLIISTPGTLTTPPAAGGAQGPAQNQAPAANTGVLGDATTTPSDNTAADEDVTATDVKGEATEKTTDATNNGNLFGIAWYWWLLILAALLAIIWWIAAAVRNRNAAQN